MEGAALAPPHQVPQIRYMIAAFVLGAAGSLIAVAAFGNGTYRVGPLIVEMEVRPATSGVTELAVEPVRTLKTGFAEAPTHAGFLALRGTVIGIVGEASLPDAVLAVKDPKSLATSIRDEGKNAFRRFALRLGWVTAAGGGAGGMAIALVGMKARRVLQGAAAGIVVVALLGLLAWKTYEIDEFSKVQFRQAGQAAVLHGG